jgi:hypothetical protein
MTDKNELNSDAPVLRQASRNHRTLVFVVTALATFLMICLLWPLNMNGYQCEALIEFENSEQGASLVKTELPTVLGNVLSTKSMAGHLESIEDTGSGLSPLLVTEDWDAISKRINIGYREGNTNRPPQLRIVLQGHGRAGEAEFVERLTAEIARQLALATERGGTIATGANSTARTLERAGWLVDQIEEGLASARNQTAALATHAVSSDQESSFRNVSHVREIRRPEIDSLHQTLDSVDVASLRGVIHDIKTSQGISNGVVRFDAGNVSSHPVGAIPDAASLLLAGMLSLLVGGIIGLNALPFSDPGFRDADDVATHLGVPVVATLGSTSTQDTNKARNTEPGWANRVFRISGSFIAFVIVAGFSFWLTSDEVRQSFNESWFHGFARIVWNLTGV